MLYHLMNWLEDAGIKFPGSALFQFITSRVLLAVIISLIVSALFGKKLINYLRKKQVGETVRDLGLAGEQSKKGTPTMGGFILILAILVPTLLLADLSKAYIRVMIFATIWLGFIGFIDDYLKLRAKRIAQQQGIAYKKGDKDGLAGWFKILGQVVLGFVVGAVLLFNQNTKVWREFTGENIPADSSKYHRTTLDGKTKVFVEADEPITTIPFVKSHEFNYSKLLPQAIRGVY
jgi:phospho-N-acetylmuramoyl-pentapeptide-transferase